MNCQRFEDIVNEIARDQIIDAGLRDLALSHSRECDECHSRLEAERGTTLQLRELAIRVKAVSAPERIETNLLQAFDSHLSAKPRTRAAFRRRYRIAAAAALVLIVLGLFVVRSRQTSQSEQTVVQNPPLKEELANQTPDNATSAPVLNEKQPVIARRPRSIRHNNADQPPATIRSLAADHLDGEIATDFLPVTYGGTANLEAGGQVVRVELPRSAMANFGLPVNIERANEKVKADVLLGVDGMAHAIRFVHKR